jgi:hypothetical protein
MGARVSTTPPPTQVSGLELLHTQPPADVLPREFEFRSDSGILDYWIHRIWTEMDHYYLSQARRLDPGSTEHPTWIITIRNGCRGCPVPFLLLLFQAKVPNKRKPGIAPVRLLLLARIKQVIAIVVPEKPENEVGESFTDPSETTKYCRIARHPETSSTSPPVSQCGRCPFSLVD